MLCDIDIAKPAEAQTILELINDMHHFIDTDHGLLDQLISRGVMQLDEVEEIRRETCETKRARLLLERMANESDKNKIDQFIEALKVTDQLHVVNVISRKGGNMRLFTDSNISGILNAL